MKIWHNETLRAPEDDVFGGGGGEGTDTLIDETGGGADDGSSGGDGSSGATTPAIDYDKMGAAMAASMRGLMPQTQQPAGMTDEEFDKKTSRPKVDVKLLQRIMNSDSPEEERAAALQELIDGSATHAVILAQMMHKRDMEALRGEMSPLMEQRRQQQFQTFEKDLVTKHPALKGQRKMLETVVANLRAQGWQPKTDSEAVQTVASTMEALIKSVNPQFSLTAGQAGGSGMASMTGGQGSGARQGGGGGKKKSWEGVF